MKNFYPIRRSAALLPAVNPSVAPLIQRKCDCGQHTVAGGECEECKEKEMTLLRHSDDSSGPVNAPPIVHEVLRTPGRPLDTEARDFFEPRFGHDFSGVRVHTDAKAAESARAVNALAYAVGHNVVFDAGRYSPSTKGGAWLLAHELAHTIQQQAGRDKPLAPFAMDAENSSSERAADSAADAVLAGRAVPLLHGSAGVLQRQRITSVDQVNNDEKIAHFDNGTRMRVRRVRWLSEETSRVGFAKATPGIDRQNVWLDIEWCAGKNHGTVRVGANIPDAVLKTILNTVTSGGDIDSAIRGISLTPFVETNILQSGSFQITGRGEVTINRQGDVTGGEGRVNVSSGPVDVSVGAGSRDVGGRPDIHGDVKVTYTPGRKTEDKDCRRERKRVVENVRFECQTERDIPARDVSETVQVRDTRTRFVYFEYASDVVHPRSGGDVSALTGDLRDGFQISRIRAFTSPEGPMARGPGFEGNDKLARKRAAAAARVAMDACKRGGSHDANSCFIGGGSVNATGEGELYTIAPLDASGVQREVEGAPLAEHAAGEFLTQPAEERHRTPAITERLTAPGTTPQQKADLVYPLLRRAEITLEHTRTENRTKHIEGRTETGETKSCPPNVSDAIFPRAVGGLGTQ